MRCLQLRRKIIYLSCATLLTAIETYLLTNSAVVLWRSNFLIQPLSCLILLGELRDAIDFRTYRLLALSLLRCLTLSFQEAPWLDFRIRLFLLQSFEFKVCSHILLLGIKGALTGLPTIRSESVNSAASHICTALLVKLGSQIEICLHAFKLW